MSSRRRIAVVGAGAAGITAAKNLLDSGLEVTVYEAGSRVGGLWVYGNDSGTGIAYKSLHINTEKRITEYTDYPFPEDTQTFPSHEDMALYLESYAREFGVVAVTRFRTPVRSIRPLLAEGGRPGIRWRVSTSEGDEDYDGVVVAVGHQSEPVYPDFASEFSGEVVHARSYREPLPFAGKRVLVVGSGNSGSDIAADICGLAERTVLVARSPELVAPKVIFGKPLTQVVGKFDKWWLPPGLPNLVRRIATRVVHGPMETWGFETPPIGMRTHPTSHPTLIGQIAYGRIKVVRGVDAVRGEEVTFLDGTREKFDVMICATGYDVGLDMLPDDVVEVRDRSFPMYMQCVSPDWPGLYFVGFSNAAASSNLRMFEWQSRLVAEFESGRGVLPDEKGIRAEQTARDRYISKHYPAGAKYTLELEPSHYVRLVRRELVEASRRLGAVRAEDLERAIANRSVGDRLAKLRDHETGHV